MASGGQEINSQHERNDDIQMKQGLLHQLGGPGTKAKDQKVSVFAGLYKAPEVIRDGQQQEDDSRGRGSETK